MVSEVFVCSIWPNTMVHLQNKPDDFYQQAIFTLIMYFVQYMSTHKWQELVIYGTLSPVWNQQFTYWYFYV